MTENRQKAASEKSRKEDRLAEALRANLAKRKAQARARAKAPPAKPSRAKE
jgi:hypothetical protein